MPTFWDKLAVTCNESNILTNSRNVVSNTSNSYIIHLTAFLVIVVPHLYYFFTWLHLQ